MKTYIPKLQAVRSGQKWYKIDAEDKVLGRLASQIAVVLMGKHKPLYVPNVDVGDFIVVTNTDKIRVTGNKANAKVYYWHTGYPGGIKERPYKEQMKRDSTKVLKLAVKNMLPKNQVGTRQLSKLKLYAGPHHEHEAQQPESLPEALTR